MYEEHYNMVCISCARMSQKKITWMEIVTLVSWFHALSMCLENKYAENIFEILLNF